MLPTLRIFCNSTFLFCYNSMLSHSPGLKSAPSLVTRSTLVRAESTSALTTGEHRDHYDCSIAEIAKRQITDPYILITEYVLFCLYRCLCYMLCTSQSLELQAMRRRTQVYSNHKHGHHHCPASQLSLN